MATSTSDITSDKQDLLQAMDYAMDFFNMWHKEGRITAEQQGVLSQYYHDNHARVDSGGPPTEKMTLRPPDICWSCRASVDSRGDDFCFECGAPLRTDEAQRLRYLIFLCYEIKKHEAAGRLNLATAHDLMAEGNDRIAALRTKLEQERAPLVKAVPKPAPPPPAAIPVTAAAPPPPRRRKPAPAENVDPAAPAAPRRNVIEILLDPRTIQWLLASGGALLVLGLIIWLAAAGLFENNIFLAVLFGVANAAVLAGGWALIYFTRYQLAGRGVTLLACLVMPLNLWFYDAQQLIQANVPGNHLWIAALVICALYAASARLLKDAMFVPVFVAGVTMTGLLLLADHMLQHFWEITAPATLLVVLGLAFLHVERLFPVLDGPFSRRRFGLAFFWSGHVVLASGLLLLFFAQLFGGWLFPVLEKLNELFDAEVFFHPEIVTTDFGRWLALLLVLAGTYAYVYSDIVVRRVGVYVAIAVFTLLWAEVLLMTIFADYLTIPAVEIVIMALALTGMLANFALLSLAAKQKTLLRVGPPLALFLCAVPALLGVMLQIQGTLPRSWSMHYELAWHYIVAMAVTAASCRVGAHLYRHERKVISTTYFFGTAAALMAGAAGLLVVASGGKMLWQNQAPLLMLIPILYLIASRLYRGHTAEAPLGWVAHAATAVMVIVSIAVAMYEISKLEPAQEKPLYLALAAFFAETMFFYGLAAVTRERSANVYLSTAAAFAAVWQLFLYFNLPHEYYTLAFAVVGLVLLILYRFAVLERYGGNLATAAFQCANAMLLLAFTAAVLITAIDLLMHFESMMNAGFDRLAAERTPLLLMLFWMVLASLFAVVLVKHQGWRRVYVGAAAANAGLAVLVLVTLGSLSPGQKLEVAAIVIGVLLLGTGHFGWYREQERHSDLTSMGLLFGSLIVTAAFTLTVVSYRWAGVHNLSKIETWFYVFNEIGMLAFGLLLLATGYACRLRATTMAGGFMTLAWLATLVLFVHLPEHAKTTAVYMMIGGGAFFATGLLLSIYRDRLLTLPDRVKRREGVFRVLSWR